MFAGAVEQPAPQPPHVLLAKPWAATAQASRGPQSSECSMSGYLRLLVRRGAGQRLGRRFGVPERVKCQGVLGVLGPAQVTLQGLKGLLAKRHASLVVYSPVPKIIVHLPP
jgi:hypothetical protein